MSTACRLYSENAGIIYNRAEHFHRAYSFDLSELHSIGNSIFMDALKRWNPDAGSFRTLLFLKLNKEMSDYIRKWKGERRSEVEAVDEGQPPYEISMDFHDRVAMLGDETREVIALVLGTPAEILGISGRMSKKEIRGCIRKMLMKKGWCCRKCTRAFKDITRFVGG